MDDKYAKNRQRVEKVAQAKGYILNPNEHWVTEILSLMTNNFREYGKYICPCKQQFPPDPKSDVLCPCPSLDQEVSKDGFCHCRLFFKPGYEKAKVDILGTITCPG
ncbi:ferredoxin:thioredoxin reductase [candidate division WOR-3 bacterium]|nr:ferredoxin:thioredoxin reductase [candidate division WOR-3 bacterium]